MQHLKHILALSVRRIRLLLCTETKSDIGNKVAILIKSSNENDFITLFKIGLPRFINKFSLRSNLN